MHTHLEAVYVIKFVPIFQYEHDNRKNKLIVSKKIIGVGHPDG